MVQGGVRSILLMGLAMAAVACAGAPPAPSSAQGEPVPAPAQPVGSDQCGAAALQWLIGEPRTSIPVPVDVSHRRVTCSSCPITEDYSETRLNILYNRDTERVERVYCG